MSSVETSMVASSPSKLSQPWGTRRYRQCRPMKLKPLQLRLPNLFHNKPRSARQRSIFKNYLSRNKETSISKTMIQLTINSKNITSRWCSTRKKQNNGRKRSKRCWNVRKLKNKKLKKWRQLTPSFRKRENKRVSRRLNNKIQVWLNRNVMDKTRPSRSRRLWSLS